MVSSEKKNFWEHSILRKQWHELITGGQQILFQKQIFFTRKSVLNDLIYPKLQKELNVKEKAKRKMITKNIFNVPGKGIM